jgi:hypothetical protein
MANLYLFILKAVARNRFVWDIKATGTQTFKCKTCKYDVLCVTHSNV